MRWTATVDLIVAMPLAAAFCDRMSIGWFW